MNRLKDWQGLFVGYDKWCKLHNIAPENKDKAYFLYSDRWMVTIMPLFILVVISIVMYFVAKDMWGML